MQDELNKVQGQYDAVTKQMKDMAQDNKTLAAKLASVTQQLDRAKARLWLGAIISQINAHARAYVFTPEKVSEDELFRQYPSVASINRDRNNLADDERKRLNEVNAIMADVELRLRSAGLKTGKKFASMAQMWGDNRSEVAHPRVMELDDGSQVVPTDQLLIPLIVDNLSGLNPYPPAGTLTADVQTTLGCLHKLARLNNADDNPFELH